MIVTPNFRDWRVASENLWLDPTHIRPYPAKLLTELASDVELGLQFHYTKGRVRLGLKDKVRFGAKKLIFGLQYGRMNSISVFEKR